MCSFAKLFERPQNLSDATFQHLTVLTVLKVFEDHSPLEQKIAKTYFTVTSMIDSSTMQAIGLGGINA